MRHPGLIFAAGILLACAGGGLAYFLTGNLWACLGVALALLVFWAIITNQSTRVQRFRHVIRLHRRVTREE